MYLFIENKCLLQQVHSVVLFHFTLYSGTSLSVVMGIPVETSILVSAGVTTLYTMVGQMISVAYTDVAQLLLMTVGLVGNILK